MLMYIVAGEKVTVALVTVMAAVPAFPAVDAVTVTGPPMAMPVTTPLEDTLARALLLDVHATWCPLTLAPAASCTTAVNCVVEPTFIDPVAGEMTTEATAEVIGPEGLGLVQDSPHANSARNTT